MKSFLIAHDRHKAPGWKESYMDLSEMKSLLNKRIAQLEEYIHTSSNLLASSPEGSLRISSPAGRKHRQFYQYFDRSCQHYLKDKDLIRALAQKDYAKLVLHSSEEQLNTLRGLLSSLQKSQPEDIYSSLSKERRSLVSPFIMTDNEFALQWQNVSYDGKILESGQPAYSTDRGEKVRSKSELLIANLYAQKNIPYRYEYPVKLRGFGTVYPDFHVLNVRLRKEFVHEHFGMMDDPVYSDHAVSKIGLYLYNGYFPGDNLILTFETRNHPIDLKQMNKIIGRYFI